MGGLGDQGSQRPLALDLKDQGPIELEGTGEQGRRRQGLAQGIADRIRVRMPAEHRPPGGIQVDQLTAHIGAVEQETVQGVGIGHGHRPVGDNGAYCAGKDLGDAPCLPQTTTPPTISAPPRPGSEAG